MNSDNDTGTQEAVAAAPVDTGAAPATEPVTMVKSGEEPPSAHDLTNYVPAEEAAVASNGPPVGDGASPSPSDPVGLADTRSVRARRWSTLES